MWRRRLAGMCMLVGEAIVFFLVAAVLASSSDADGPSFVTALLATAGGYAWVRLLLRFDTARTALVIAAIGGTVLALLVLLSVQYDRSPLTLAWIRDFTDDPDTYLTGRWGAVWGIVVVLCAWLRGAWLAQRDLTYQRAMFSFTLGLGVVVCLLLFGQSSRAADAINTGALPFIVAGLLTLSLVHLSRAEYQQSDLLRGPWLATLGGTVGGLAVVAAIIGLFPIGLFNQLLAPVGTIVLRLIDLMVLAIAFPLGLLITWIISLITGGRQLNWPTPDRVASEGAQRLQQQSNQGGPPELIALFFKALFILTVATIIGYILWRAFRRLMRPPRDPSGGETRESLAGEGGLGSDLNALLGAMLGRFRRGEPEHEPELPADVLAVRRLYVRALRRAESAGSPRPPAATPLEFAPALAGTLDTPVAVTLSHRFAAARYGLVAPTPESLTQLDHELGRG